MFSEKACRSALLIGVAVVTFLTLSIAYKQSTQNVSASMNGVDAQPMDAGLGDVTVQAEVQ